MPALDAWGAVNSKGKITIDNFPPVVYIMMPVRLLQPQRVVTLCLGLLQVLCCAACILLEPCSQLTIVVCFLGALHCIPGPAEGHQDQGGD